MTRFILASLVLAISILPLYGMPSRGAPPFSLGRKSFDAFDQHTSVPRPVENNYLTLLRQVAPESLQVMFGTLMLIGR